MVSLYYFYLPANYIILRSEPTSPRIRKKRTGQPKKQAGDGESRSVVPPLIIIFLIGVVGAVELTTNFVEKAAGAYLNWRNAEREAWGTLWVKEASKRDAARQLDAETAETTRLRRKAELVNSFAELIPLMPDGVGVPITPAKFVKLYRKIPPALQNNLLPPVELAKLYWSDRIRRVSAWIDGGKLRFYLIDDRNRVIRDVIIDESLLKAASSYGKTTPGRIDNMPVFAGNTMSSARFFSLFYAMTELEQTKLLIDPAALLTVAKPVTKVGMGIREKYRFGVLGFESIGADGYYVTTFPVLKVRLEEFISVTTGTKQAVSESPLHEGEYDSDRR